MVAALGPCVIGVMAVGTSKVATAVAWRWPYHCYFDQKSVNLTDRCHEMLREAAASWQRESEGREYKSDAIDPSDPYAPPYTARFRVLGYASDADDATAADRLSVRRASAVAAELEQLGIPSDLITVVGFGDDEPLVPNAPKDPQNRLVDIQLR